MDNDFEKYNEEKNNSLNSGYNDNKYYSQEPKVYYSETVKPKNKNRLPIFILLLMLISLFSVAAGITIGSSITSLEKSLPKFIQKYFDKDSANVAQDEEVEQKFTIEEPTDKTELAQKIVTPVGTSPVVEIANEVGPSVVTVTSTVQAKDWFDNSFEQEGTGSGIIFGEGNDELYIVTNYHVIEQARRVAITLLGESTVSGTIKGYDSQTDLAVLEIKKSDIPSDTKSKIKIANLGDSDKLQVGELAVAIGNPMGKQFNNTVTVGVISAVHREVQLTDKSLELVQTDAAINPGNSGGALVNSKGEVIGINTIKLVDERVEGMGFAIPINFAKPIIQELVNAGSVARPYLGIMGADINEEMSQLYEIPLGIYVKEVTEGGAAKEAGVQPGDIIIEFNGEKITSMQQLANTIKKMQVGDKVEIKIVRNQSKKIVVTAKLKDYNQFNQ